MLCLTIATGAAAAGTVLTSCGGAQHPAESAPAPATALTSPAGTPAASPSPTPTRTGPLPTGPGVQPGQTPPTLADAGKASTTSGALTFAKFYFQAIDWSIATMDPYLIQKYSEPNCKSCTDYITDITGLAKTGGYFVGSRITANDAEISFDKFDIPSSFAVKLMMSQSPQAVVASPGASPSMVVATPESGSLWLLMDWVDGGLQAREIVGS